MTDEIGTSGDKNAVMQVVNTGVKVITRLMDIMFRSLKPEKEVLSLMQEKVFERYVVLSAKGTRNR